MITFEKLVDYCSKNDIKVCMYRGKTGQWCIDLTKYGKSAEIKDGMLLRSFCGDGETLNDAAKNLIKKINGEHIVFGAYSNLREEFDFLFTDETIETPKKLESIGRNFWKNLTSVSSAYIELEQKVITLEKITGMSIDKLIAAFLAGDHDKK